MSKFVHAFIASAPAEWLRQNGGLPDAVSAEALASPVGVPIEHQRLMLREVVQRGGEQALFALPAVFPDTTDQPLLFVMLNSRDVDDFIDKEQRFGRFIHSDHGVRVLQRAERMIELQHFARSGAPLREESLLVLAIHLQMFQLLGCRGLTACLPGSQEPEKLVYSEDAVAQQFPAGDSGRWRMEYREFHARREPMKGLDELLVRSSAPTNLEAGVDASVRVERVVRTDLAHRWTVAEVARLLFTSTRTLQRELSASGTSFSRLLDALRIEVASELLADPARSVTEVGYICGFSDSAHFSRRFKANKGAAPQVWRATQRS
ncbi:MAG: helix-turn-helix transcriptional regulator [bacterium]|nr:helix-turn-helix transcriptional regulator [bacterium]